MKGRYTAWILTLAYSCLFMVARGQSQPGAHPFEFKRYHSIDSFGNLIPDSLYPSNPVTSNLFRNSFSFQKKLKLQSYFYTKQLAGQNKHALNFSTIALPAAGIGYGFFALHSNIARALNYSTKNEIREDHPLFQTHLDNYFQWSPAAAVIGLNLAGIHGKHPFKDELCIYGVSTIIMLGVVESLKPITHELRPDGSSYRSFPSGHTATAFAAAEWLRMEYWHRSPWIGIAGYAVAASVGVLRVYNNRHWVSDVIAGAAIGFLSTRIAYTLNPWIKRHILHAGRKGKKLTTWTGGNYPSNVP